ncbi:uncharacterized protein VTP21DRAFT_11149 [Calcarisporiella thermophila]|uniref:uncharacterized protein n=1 Tax=Calcarisporiella thermophila TaxID=911321 RepID=UPI003743C4E5
MKDQPTMTFVVPRRKIVTKEDLERFHESSAYNEFVKFIENLNESVKSVKISYQCHESEIITKLLNLLESIHQICRDIPPVENSKSRFGNPAFRDFYDRVAENAPQLLQSLLDQSAIIELSKYLIESWGNRTRIDYGTGHEANFIAFLFCIEKLGLIGESDYQALVLRVFVKYIDVMRALQFSYWLEPAGSHGVWGLDDYHFLPFLFGSAQLIGHKYMRPKSIHDKEIVDEFSKDYMYLACIKFINSVKTASLRWHSPMLDDISGVKTWEKVNQGMIKMYKAEVLGKLPIMQHFMFGSLIPFEASSSLSDEDENSNSITEDEHGHVHVYAMGQEFPECCGIKMPSAIAANPDQRIAKRLPFD